MQSKQKEVIFYLFSSTFFLFDYYRSSYKPVIVMNNATFHKRKDMADAIEKEVYILEYLPPYSPDLNPIEHKWFAAKALRKREKITVEDTFKKYDKL